MGRSLRTWMTPLNSLGKSVRTNLNVREILDEQFGSSVNRQGYKELNPHVGLIYGDSITYDRCKKMCEQLKRKGYASTNLVYGVGSFTFQYNTRDTFSMACKATWAQVDGVGREIFKDPITDNGTKKSACGLLQVVEGENGYELRDCVSREEEQETALEVVFQHGTIVENLSSLEEIRDRLAKYRTSPQEELTAV